MTESGKTLEKKIRDKLNSKSLFDMFSKDKKQEDCAEGLVVASHRYAVEKDYLSAVRCLKDANSIFATLKFCDHNVRSNLKLIIEYGKQENTCSPEELISIHKKLARSHIDIGEFTKANEQYIEIANIYDQQNKPQAALKVLNECANDKQFSKVLEKKADLLLKQNAYKEAAKVFRELADEHLKKDSQISNIYARPSIFMHVLCHMATKDMPTILQVFSDESILDFSFLSSSEGKCINGIINALKNNDVLEFEHVCSEYERLKKFSPQQVEMLLLAKEIIEGEVEQQNDDNIEDLC